MHIKQLVIENFQSHKKAVLDFHPGFNTIVGVSNVGKTSVTRALSFILSGTWDTSWVRHGEKTAKITLLTDTDITVIREKGEKVNRYVLQIPGKVDQTYENFGTEIPSDIEKVLQIFKVQIDANEYLNLNISSQLDPLFLLSKPGSFKAKVLGKLSGAHYLDYALREINKDRKNLQQEKNLRDMEAVELQVKLVEFASLDAEKSKLDAAAKQMDNLVDLEKRIEALKTLFLRVQDWKGRYQAEITKEAQLEALLVPTVDSLDILATRLTTLRDLQTKISRNSASHDLAIIDLNKAIKASEAAKESYLGLLKQNPTCPVCTAPVDEAALSRIGATL
jgi:exonuclease SbcC